MGFWAFTGRLLLASVFMMSGAAGVEQQGTARAPSATEQLQCPYLPLHSCNRD